MEEREIDLIDMLADILAHWRSLLAAVLAGADKLLPVIEQKKF